MISDDFSTSVTSAAVQPPKWFLIFFCPEELDAEIFLALRPQRLAESPLTGYFRTAPVPKMSSPGELGRIRSKLLRILRYTTIKGIVVPCCTMWSMYKASNLFKSAYAHDTLVIHH